jgi:predicted DNA binding CopG/RHH family protein
MQLDESTIEHVKRLADTTELPYQSLINLDLRACAARGRRLSMSWRGEKATV